MALRDTAEMHADGAVIMYCEVFEAQVLPVHPSGNVPYLRHTSVVTCGTEHRFTQPKALS
jgi:hypothetical protein